MKKIKSLAMLVISGLIAITINSCEKYDEGGFIYKTEKNLKKSWTLQKYLRNSVDETSLIKIKNYEETYSDNESYTRNYVDEKGDSYTETGKWIFDKESNELKISGISSLKINTPNTSTISSSYYKILKLEDSQFWYYYTNGNDSHEFRFIKK